MVNHLAHGNARVAEWAGAGPAAPPGDYLGADPPGAFTASVARAREVLAEPGLATRLVTTPLGDVPGSLLVHMRLNEYLAHGWDVADATGQPTDFVPDLAEQALESWRTRFGDQAGPWAVRSRRSSRRPRTRRRPTGWRRSSGGRRCAREHSGLDRTRRSSARPPAACAAGERRGER
ncbi:hypothetical protein [Amycolatopsis sp. NPDC050768]|uniref:hypothetical protein n=1 Tax=Amycolatopsis sp. NPDC050768 TaxID=3154839 RepID=UPI0033EC84E5